MTSNQHLTTERLHLKPFEEDHLAFLYALWIDPDVRRYLWDDRSITEAEAAAVIDASRTSFRDSDYGFWILVERDSAQPIGFAGLRELGDPPEVELLYGLDPRWWGRGLATEASRAVLDHGFTACRLPRILAGTDPPNTASIAVIERLGMEPEGQRTIDGVPALYYALENPAFVG